MPVKKKLILSFYHVADPLRGPGLVQGDSNATSKGNVGVAVSAAISPLRWGRLRQTAG